MRSMTVRLDDSLDDRLNSLASETGRTKSFYTKLALQEFLDDREDYLLGIAVLERNEPTISLNAVERELGLVH